MQFIYISVHNTAIFVKHCPKITYFELYSNVRLKKRWLLRKIQARKAVQLGALYQNLPCDSHPYLSQHQNSQSFIKVRGTRAAGGCVLGCFFYVGVWLGLMHKVVRMLAWGVLLKSFCLFLHCFFNLKYRR